MPYIPQALIDSVFYLYPSIEDAFSDTNVGGTGFFVHLPPVEYGKNPSFVYAVTCDHVPYRCNSPVIRANKKDGYFDVIQLRQKDWMRFNDVFNDDRCDLAIYYFENFPQEYEMGGISLDLAIEEHWVRDRIIGMGSEVFMIGRYIGVDGEDTNEPSSRTGSISQLPVIRVLNEDGHYQKTFMVEMRTLPGYSGSPVFVYAQQESGSLSIRGAVNFALLGIHSSVLTDGGVNKAPAGISQTIPAWHIRRMLMRHLSNKAFGFSVI